MTVDLGIKKTEFFVSFFYLVKNNVNMIHWMRNAQKTRLMNAKRPRKLINIPGNNDDSDSYRMKKRLSKKM